MTQNEQDVLKSLREILVIAIQREQEAYSFYVSARQSARTKAEEEMFIELAAQEMQHKRTLEIRLDEIDGQLEIDRALSYEIY